MTSYFRKAADQLSEHGLSIGSGWYKRQALIELYKLGNTPDKVADTLRYGGYLGTVGNCTTCPVALYLKDKLNCTDIFVDAYEITMVGADWSTELEVPSAVKRFICAFDCGDYPNLEVVDNNES